MKERKIALFDIDGTIHDGILLFPLAKRQHEDGIIDTECLRQLDQDLQQYKSGATDYEFFAKELLIHWAAGLEGKFYETVLDQARRFIDGDENNFFPFLLQVTALLSDTYDIYFITGETDFVAENVTQKFQGNGYISSEFEKDGNGRFTGRVKSFLATREEKKNAIKPLLEEHDRSDSFAFGDTEGDIEILESADNPICVNPTPGLSEIAKQRGWVIVKPKEVVGVIRQKFIK